MTITEIEYRMLSMRSWLLRCVLPSALSLVVLLLIFGRVTRDPQILNNNSVIVGFFIVYFVLIRGGHLIMIRSLHKELKKTYGDAYAKRLRSLPNTMKSRNLGFTLARIKREFLNQKR